MRVSYPKWEHLDEKKNKTCIFSIHVHPDGSRVATGGLDAKIRVWSTAAVYDESKENKGNLTELLCTMGLHTGPVLCVRWSQIDGRYLASGSDDKIILVWELDSGYGGKVFGSNEQNVENWKISKRLTGHESDVADIAWSHDNAWLASCGLDSLVFIWDGRTFEKIQKIEHHHGFVKGVAWDPVGKYLATQSDDKTLKLWKTADWKIEAQIREPFLSSPTTTFFRRLSWSPDGTHLAAANGYQGAVAIAPILVREEWIPDISLVGHSAAIGVVQFNPALFMIPENDDAEQNSSSIGSICAVGSQDNSISVWATKKARPLFVSQRPFKQSVMDLAWAPNGRDLYACSYDGSVLILRFSDKEFGVRVKTEEKEKILAKYGYKRKEPICLENASQVGLEQERAIMTKNLKSKRLAELMQGEAAPTWNQNGASSSMEIIEIEENSPPAHQSSVLTHPPSLESKSSASAHSTVGSLSTVVPKTNEKSQPSIYTTSDLNPTTTGLTVQKFTITKEGKRRIQPQFLRGLSSPLAPSPIRPAFTSSSHQPTEFAHSLSSANGSSFNKQSTPQESQSQPDYLSNDHAIAFHLPSTDLPPGGIPALVIGNKRKEPSTSTSDVDKPSKKQSNRGKPGDDVDIDVESSGVGSAMVSPMVTMSQVRLALPKVSSNLKKELKNFKLDCQNFLNAKKPSKLTCSNSDGLLWIDYIQSTVMLLTGHEKYCAASCEDGSLQVYSAAGKRLLPPIMLESPVSYLNNVGDYLLSLTQTGLINVWDLLRRKAIISSISIAPILQAATVSTENFTKQTITAACLRPNGIPMLRTTSGDVWIYHLEMKTWIRAHDPRYINLRTVTGVPDISENLPTALGIMRESGVESNVENLGIMAYLNPTQSNNKETQLETSQSLGYIENEMAVAEILNSRTDLRRNLALYAQQLADLGAVAKAQELCQELWASNTSADFTNNGASNCGSPIASISKRFLLREILPILASNRSYQRIIAEYEARLRDQQPN
ncbi:hypothetical protein G9A89_003297 [Geosiphon pyriformis]|nr:hypothetical protein G9A89_003297 [Geosiphon pyriformis]